MPPPTLAPPFDASGAPCVVRTAVIRINNKTSRRVIRDDWFDDRPEVADAVSALCATCPVRHECLALANAFEDTVMRFGVFGGKTPEERNGRKRKKPPVKARPNTTARHPSGEFRRCLLCSTPFYRRQIESPRQWAVRKFCCREHAAEFNRSVRLNKGKTP